MLGWGVGGIEAEAAMLGQPISMLLRDYCLRLVYQMEQPGNERVTCENNPLWHHVATGAKTGD